MYNLKQAKSGFDTIPDDRYTLKIDGVTVTPHKKDATEGHRFEVTFTIADGDFKGRKCWDNVYLPWATWKMYALLEAGGSPEIGDESATPEKIATALEGLGVISAYLATEMGTNGKPRTNVTDYKSVSAMGTVDATPDMVDFDRLKQSLFE